METTDIYAIFQCRLKDYQVANVGLIGLKFAQTNYKSQEENKSTNLVLLKGLQNNYCLTKMYMCVVIAQNKCFSINQRHAINYILHFP